MLGAIALGEVSLAAVPAYGPAMPFVELGAQITITSSITAAIETEQQIPAPGTPTYPPTINLPSNLLIAANNKKTTLAEVLAIDALTLTLTDASSWPTSGAVTLDVPAGRTNTSSEIVYFDDRTGNVLTLTERARGGTAAKEWAAGMSAEMRMTAEHHNLLANGIIAVETKLDTKADTASTITSLTGDVTASGAGETTATISNDAVTFAKIQNIATSKLLGRGTAETGNIEELTLGTGLSLSGTTLNASASSAIDPTASPYNALGDGVEVTDGSMTASSTTFTSATAAFTSADAGKRILIDGAGAATDFGVIGGTAARKPLVTTISSVTNSTTIVLGSAPQATGTGVRFVYGTDDTAAIQSAFNDCDTFGGNAVTFPAGRIFFTSAALTIKRYAKVSNEVGGGRMGTIRVSGYGATIICHTDNNFIQLSPNNIAAIYHSPVIEGLNLEGIGGQNQIGISLDHTFNAVMRDLCIRRVGVGIDLRGALQAHCTNVMVEYFTKYGFWLRQSTDTTMPCNVCVLDGTRANASSIAQYGYYLVNSDQCEIRNGISESSWQPAQLIADIFLEQPVLTDYGRQTRITNFYSEVTTFSVAMIRIVSNGTTVIEDVHRFEAPGAPLVDVTGSAASSIVLRDWKVTDHPIAAVNSWITFKQNAANTVGWLFENMGEFSTGEARELTSNTAFWVGAVLPNKATQIEPGRVVNRSV